jgi:hypothetical protein
VREGLALSIALPHRPFLAVAAVCSLACSTLPATSQFRIESVVRRGPFLDARMSRGDREIRFFFPSEDESCRRVVRTEQHVEYVSTGVLGRMRAGDASCDPVGIGSLDWWGRRGGRREAPPVPRATARFQPFYGDDEVLMVRGRFPLTNLVNWGGGFDTIAVLPRNEACQRLLERGEATIEHRAAGRVPLRLVSSGESCVIEGLVQPPSASGSLPTQRAGAGGQRAARALRAGAAARAP